MIRQQIESILFSAIDRLAGEGFLGSADGRAGGKISVTVCPDRAHGDYASGAAMQLAASAKKDPRAIAERIKEEILKSPKAARIFSKIEVAPPGFVNFFLAPVFLQSETAKVLKLGPDYGKVNFGKKKLTQVEFVSANPSGMLHIGNGRSAFYGDALANVLEFAGYDVEREYYINDAKVSKQIQELGKTAQGLGISYLSPYLEDLIKKLRPRISKLRSQTEAGYFLAREITKDLKKFITGVLGIKFDEWVSEEKLYKQGKVMAAYAQLKKEGLVFEKDDAYWLDLSKFNQKDEVLLRSDGSPTYFLSDVGYHRDKITRGYKKIIDIWGADHQGHIPRMKAAMEMLGYKGEFEVLTCQIVNLNGARISKRTGNIVSLDWLVGEVGVDAARFFYLQNSLSSQMDFDIDLAKKKSSDSPVFYVQYAHARIASILRRAGNRGKHGPASLRKLAGLEHSSELDLMKKILRFPEIIEDSARDYQIQRVCLYARELAASFHKFYCDCQVISDDARRTRSRLALAQAAKIALENTLAVLGISAPGKM